MSFIFINKNTMVRSEEIDIITRKIDADTKEESLFIVLNNKEIKVDIPFEVLIDNIKKNEKKDNPLNKQFVSL